METLLKVFAALKAKVKFQVDLPKIPELNINIEK